MSPPWRDEILAKLYSRNRKQRTTYESIVKYNNRIAEEIGVLRAKTLQYQIQVDKLNKENLELLQNSQDGRTGASGKFVTALEQKCAQLEQKNYRQLEELTELHKKKGENSQQIIDLTAKLSEKEREVSDKNGKLVDMESIISDLTTNKDELEGEIKTLQASNQLLQDEMQALHMSYDSLSGKFHQCMQDNNDLVTRWMKSKSKDADRMNEENEQIIKIKQAKIAQQLEEAAKEMKEVQEPDMDVVSPAIAYVVSIPDKAIHTLENADGEINAVKWSVSGRYFATGGNDRKAKVWEIMSNQMSRKYTLGGINGYLLCVDFDTQDSHVIGGTSDYAIPLWTIPDQRQRIVLTGHSGKVLAAKFFDGVHKVLSGSMDRTLKLWDVRKNLCDRTLFAGSSCYDLVMCDSLASCVMSGHFDRKVRFWDLRSDKSTNDILLNHKVTSLDISPDGFNLLCCCRDNAIHVIDLRMNQVQKSLTADGFTVGCDWTRASFSPDGMYVVCGSTDGPLYIWNIYKNSVEKVLKEHNGVVVAAAWDPKGSSIVSADKNKALVYWAAF